MNSKRRFLQSSLSRSAPLTLALLAGVTLVLGTASAQHLPGHSGEARGAQQNPHNRHALPPIEIDERNHRVKVETPDGPRWIRTCVEPGPEGRFESAPPEAAGRSGRGSSSSSTYSPPTGSSQAAAAQAGATALGYPGCLSCHTNIENASENMFGMNLDCTFCHGGDPYAGTKASAHIHSNGSTAMDNTVPSFTDDLEYQQFLNPSNLRVVDNTCALCHQSHVADVKKSMMSTTAGHFAGGLYLNNVVDTKTPIYGNLAIVDDDGWVPTAQGAVASLLALLEYDPAGDPALFSTHYAAVPAQACARCHLWSRGKGYRGAIGAEGTYRADGCAACHMPYANDGLSQSADTAIDHQETGHPLSHTITKKIPTETCLHCHHRGARIGLSFTGKAQMPPRLPSGPSIPGTTNEKFNGNYHYTVADTNPQDIHNELGIACIDCHTGPGVMGDGNIWGHMDQATKIECRSCHGLPNQPPTLMDNEGGTLNNVELDIPSGNIIMTSKVTGAQHIVKRTMDLVDPLSVHYNANAAAAMDANHLKQTGGLECYSCHSSWLPNCYGCHFERDEQQMGQNLITGLWEVGKVTTNNKIFEALRQFSYGPNSEGRAAPYLVACQPIADVTAPDGTKILDYQMPVTSNGLSGLALNPVNPHTVRGTGDVRTCTECHRSPASLGFGSGNYNIARDRVYLGSALRTEMFDRDTNPGQPVLQGALGSSLSTYGLATSPNLVEGIADFLYTAEGTAGLKIFDRRPGQSGASVSVTGINAIDVSRAARYLYVIDAGVGLKIYDNQAPLQATLVGSVSIPGALRVVPFGIHLFVAAGTSGLFVVDVADHNAPAIVANLGGFNAADVELYSHYQSGQDFAVRAYVADPGYGVRIVDLLPNFQNPQLVGGLPLPGASGLDAYSRYVTATATEPSREHDYLFVAAGASGLQIYDITKPDTIVAAGAITTLSGIASDISIASQLAPPGVDDYAYIANASLGLQVVLVSDPLNPQFLGTVSGSTGGTRVLVEVQQMDRFLDEQGTPLKENSHPFTDTYTRADIVRLLSVTLP